MHIEGKQAVAQLCMTGQLRQLLLQYWPGQGSPRRAVRYTAILLEAHANQTAAARGLPFWESRPAAADGFAGCALVRLALLTAETASIHIFERWPASDPSEAAITMTALLTPALCSPPPWRSRLLAGALEFTFVIVYLVQPRTAVCGTRSTAAAFLLPGSK